MIEMINISKSYNGERQILRDLTLHIRDGEYIQIVGGSGAGKSTFLNVIGLLDRNYAGKLKIAGRSVDKISDTEISAIRCCHIGFIFQSYNLIHNMSVMENISLPAIYAKGKRPDWKKRIEEKMSALGIWHLKNQFIQYLSGGEKQRVAIARALLLDPDIILADEPTGNLDVDNANIIFETLRELHRQKKTIVMVTHNTYVASGADHIYRLADGKLYE